MVKETDLDPSVRQDYLGGHKTEREAGSALLIPVPASLNELGVCSDSEGAAATQPSTELLTKTFLSQGSGVTSFVSAMGKAIGPGSWVKRPGHQ